MPFRKDWRRAHTLTGPIKIWMAAHALAILQGLILISAANGAPVLFARLLGARFAHPIDGGIVLRDGHPLLGRSKSWLGLGAAVILTTCAAALMILRWRLRALIAASAMAGHGLLSSSNGGWARPEQHDGRSRSVSLSRCFPRPLA